MTEMETCRMKLEEEILRLFVILYG